MPPLTQIYGAQFSWARGRQTTILLTEILLREPLVRIPLARLQARPLVESLAPRLERRWGGPVGGAVGAAVGAVAGGLAGHAAGEAVNPSVEDIYWRQAHIREPYYRKDFTYDDYGPAYRTGWEGASRYYGQNRRFDDVEPSCAATISASRVNRDSPGKMRRPRPALPGIASSGPCRATQTTTVVSVQVPAASFARRLASCPTRGSIYGEAAGTDKATT